MEEQNQLSRVTQLVGVDLKALASGDISVERPPIP
jgi:hypothetical protein